MSAKGAKDKGKEKTKGKEDGAAEGSPKKAKTDPKKEKGKGAPASEDAAQRGDAAVVPDRFERRLSVRAFRALLNALRF